jgi:hypothetical protein
MMHRLLCIFILCGGILLQPIYSHDARGEDPQAGGVADTAGKATPLPTSEDFIKLGTPFFSPPFDDTPVALIDDDEAVTKHELAKALALQEEQSGDHPGERQQEYLRVLNRLINSRLIYWEALNIGLDERADVKSRIEDFKRKQLRHELMSRHLRGLEPNPVEVEKMYRNLSREVELHSLVFPQGPAARMFLDEVKKGDFEQVAKRYIEEGRLTERKNEAYVKIKDLRPEVAKEAYSMEAGGLSKIYRIEEGHLLYRLVDTRFVEDPSAREEASRRVYENARTKKALEYGFALQGKYVEVDEDLYEQLDFDADLAQLQRDKRILAKAKGEDDSFVLTVADLAADVKGTFYHGADKAAKLKMINERKEKAVANRIFTYTSDREARRLGLDQTEDFKRKVEDFERAVMFNTFMNKLVLPEVEVAEKEIRTYYDEHLDEYSSSAMLRIKSMVFHNRQDAELALSRLRKGADFNWISANAVDLVDPDANGILPLDKKLLSLTSLPEDLHELARDVKKGDSLLYAPSEGDFYYVLLMTDVYPPEPRPYEEARQDALKKVYGMKSEKVLDDWIEKLKEVYPVRILPADTGQ